jgi:hypothetical protein
MKCPENEFYSAIVIEPDGGSFVCLYENFTLRRLAEDYGMCWQYDTPLTRLLLNVET